MTRSQRRCACFAVGFGASALIGTLFNKVVGETCVEPDAIMVSAVACVTFAVLTFVRTK